MKKNSAFLIIIFLIILSGCSDSKSEFKDVSRVTFTSGGVTKTLYPTWYIIRGNFEIASKEEYDNSEHKVSVMTPGDVTVSTIEFYTSNLFSDNIYDNSEKPYKPHGISEQGIGDYLYIYAHNLGHYSKSYFKAKIKDVGSISLKIKVIDSSTIVIKQGVIETTYTVTSYSVLD